MKLLFEIEALEQPQQIGFVFWDKLNLVQKKKMLKEIKQENFFNDFLYRKFNDYNDFINKAKREKL